jgi:hypothetical protein
LADEFGSSIAGIDIVTGAKAFSTRSGKKLVAKLGVAEKAAEEAAEKVTKVTLANGLSEMFAEESGRRWLTFMGKPLAETTSVAKTLGKATGVVYKAAPAPVQRTVDLARRMFAGEGWPKAYEFIDTPVAGAEEALQGLATAQPQYVESALRGLAGQTASKAQTYRTTRLFIQDAQRLLRNNPNMALRAVETTVGEDVFKNQKLGDALTFFIEKDITHDGGAAARAWANIEKTLTPEELKLVQDASAEVKMLTSSILSIDNDILKQGITPAANYIPHAYVVNKTAQGFTKPEGIAAQILSTRNYHEMERAIPSVAYGIEHADELAKAGITVVTDARVSLAARVADTYKR